MNKPNISLWQVGWFMGSIAASAAIMLAFYPYWLVVMLFAILISHELGHYGAAKILDVKSALPMFIPLGPLVMGATYIPVKDQSKIRKIALAGPIAGLTVAGAMFLAFLLIGSNIGMFFAGSMALREIITATIGSDGRKFRKAKKGVQPKISVSSVSVPFNIHADWSIA